MTSPALVATTAGAWKKVATAIKTGTFRRATTEVQYFTYVDTGGAAPNAATVTSGLANRIDSKIILNNSVNVDAYIYSVDVVGNVEVQL